VCRADRSAKKSGTGLAVGFDQPKALFDPVKPGDVFLLAMGARVNASARWQS